MMSSFNPIPLPTPPSCSFPRFFLLSSVCVSLSLAALYLDSCSCVCVLMPLQAAWHCSVFYFTACFTKRIHPFPSAATHPLLPVTCCVFPPPLSLSLLILSSLASSSSLYVKPQVWRYSCFLRAPTHFFGPLVLPLAAFSRLLTCREESSTS